MKVTPRHTEECKRLLTLMGIPYVEVQSQVVSTKECMLSAYHSLPLSLSLSLSLSLFLPLSLSLSLFLPLSLSLSPSPAFRLPVKQRLSVLLWSKQVLSMLLLQRTWTRSRLVQTSCFVISQLVKQSKTKFLHLNLAIPCFLT